MPTGEWSWVDCGADQCAQLTIDGVDTVMLRFTDDGTAYSLTSITEL